jgi:hypothetical protein
MISHNARNHSFRYSLVAIAAAGLLLGVAGCEKKKKPAPPPPPPPPPAPVMPDPVDVNGLMSSLSPDARVQFPESKAPADQSLATAAIRLADAFAKGDTSALRGMLTPEARGPLEALVAEGLWSEETKKLDQVRIVQVDPQYDLDVSRGTIVLALQVPGGAYPLAWEARKRGGDWVFKNMPVEDRELPRASAFDSVSLRLGAGIIPDQGEIEQMLRDAGIDPAILPQGEAPAEPEHDPFRRGTPAGPITIPGKPGGGGSGGS